MPQSMIEQMEAHRLQSQVRALIAQALTPRSINEYARAIVAEVARTGRLDPRDAALLYLCSNAGVNLQNLEINANSMPTALTDISQLPDQQQYSMPAGAYAQFSPQERLALMGILPDGSAD